MPNSISSTRLACTDSLPAEVDILARTFSPGISVVTCADALLKGMCTDGSVRGLCPVSCDACFNDGRRRTQTISSSPSPQSKPPAPSPPPPVSITWSVGGPQMCSVVGPGDPDLRRRLGPGDIGIGESIRFCNDCNCLPARSFVFWSEAGE